MTLEEIKAEIKRTIAILTKRIDTNGVIALYSVLAMLDQLEPSWHPYPAEKPKDDEYYLVTKSCGIVKEMFYEDGYFYDTFSWGIGSQNDYVIAWMELPKPYKKEAE